MPIVVERLSYVSVSEISSRQSFPWYFALKMFPLPLALAHDRVTVMLYNLILGKKIQMTISVHNVLKSLNS